MKGYTAEIILDQHTTLANIDAILQKLQEQGRARFLFNPFRIEADWEANDEWTLRGLLEEVKYDLLANWDLSYEIDKEKIFDI